ncbi:hypothetical protein [Paracoccus rhizosphaerae]|uniref:DUF2946 domain-containing protein n=1 Tax=Paracoccus rhizosphaerae TaxID=1133347 RepID=A0ABV6CDR0_9RHOB|nr:hypothetical protein [Paracoccus rhizosphaerae]
MGCLIPFRILCLTLLTMVSLAFASATVVQGVPTLSDVRLEAYVLAAGSVADLCLHDEPQHSHPSRCSLCHLIAGCDLPPADLRLIAIEQRVAAAIIRPQIERATLCPRDPATPLRGPPVQNS